MSHWNPPTRALVDWASFDQLVEEHQKFTLTTHVNPDGDGIGSEVALALYLKSLGKSVTILNQDEAPFNFAFVTEHFPIQTFDEDTATAIREQTEVLVILDTSTQKRVGRLRSFIDAPHIKVAIIDHHLAEPDFADVAIVEPEACATGELVYDYIRRNAGGLTQPIAQAIFAAVVTDTGSFRFSNTDPEALTMAAHLVSVGVEPEVVSAQIYRHRHSDRVRFLGTVLTQMQLNQDGTVAWLEITRELMNKFRINGEDTEGLVDFPRTIPGVEVVAMFTETDNGRIKVSLRSAGLVNVSELAGSFGGGGHRVASGALVKGPLESARGIMIPAVEQAIEEARKGVARVSGEARTR